jgi:EmrB/QacA subfamily drug resistance transporter
VQSNRTVKTKDDGEATTASGISTPGALNPGTSSEPPHAAIPVELSPRQLWVILGSLMLGTVLAALDTTIVSTALPTIAGQLGGFSSYAWVGTSYIVTSTIATPILGKLGDLFGRRKIVLSAILIFVFASLLCGLAQSMPQLIAARGLQGLGGGGIQALTFAILGDLVSPRERGRYMGLYTGIYAGTAVIGPLLGGWMISHFSWPWIFLINLPVGAVALVAIMATLKIPFVKRAVHIDFAGATLLSLALGSLILSLDRGKHGWTKAPVLLLLALSFAVFVAFFLVERRVPEPLIPLRLFKNRVFAIASTMGFLAGTLSFGAQQFLPLQFQDANFFSPTKAGLCIAPIMAGIMIGSALGGRLIARTGRYKIFPIVGIACTIFGVAAFSQITVTTPYAFLVLPMLGIGIGNGSTFTTTSIATQNRIDPSDIGIGTATLVGLRSLGGSLGLALYGTLFNARVSAVLGNSIPTTPDSAGAKLGTKAITSILREPKKIRELDPVVRAAVAKSVTAGTARIFLAALPLAVVAFVLAVMLPEYPLRTDKST